MSGTEAGRRLVRVRDLHTPDCPRWSAVSTPDARCTYILPEMVAAVEAEARAESVGLREAAVRVLAEADRDTNAFIALRAALAGTKPRA